MPGPGRPFPKGKSANPKGRPPVGDSLAEQIRASASPARRKQLFDQMWALAVSAHPDPRARLAAAEWLAKHGWPDEARGVTTVTTEGGKTVVKHEHVTST